jgi:hypothetical protein
MHKLRTFNSLMSFAQSDLRRAQAASTAEYRATWLKLARNAVASALSVANAMRDRKRQALCLKILNWLRADLRRLAV